MSVIVGDVLPASFDDQKIRQTEDMKESILGKEVVLPKKETPFIVRVKFIINPHCHLREAVKRMMLLIQKAIEGGARVLGLMPNTIAGLKTCEEVAAYIRTAEGFEITKICNLRFIKFCMITPSTTLQDMLTCISAGIVDFKVYPYGRTTQSGYGIKEYWPIIGVIREAASIALDVSRVRIKVHFHPEHPDEIFSNDDAEYGFISICMMTLESTEAIIVWEHGTDATRCGLFWREMAIRYPKRFYLTITAHHLVTNSTKTYGDARATCKPSFKKEEDRLALVALIKENHYWVMLGADDAPHPKEKKHPDVGRCACGAYTAPFLIELCAHALDDLLRSGLDGVKVFTNFTTDNAAALHGIDAPAGWITLERSGFDIPKVYIFEDWTVESFWAGEKLLYKQVADPVLIAELTV